MSRSYVSLWILCFFSLALQPSVWAQPLDGHTSNASYFQDKTALREYDSMPNKMSKKRRRISPNAIAVRVVVPSWYAYVDQFINLLLITVCVVRWVLGLSWKEMGLKLFYAPGVLLNIALQYLQSPSKSVKRPRRARTSKKSAVSTAFQKAAEEAYSDVRSITDLTALREKQHKVSSGLAKRFEHEIDALAQRACNQVVKLKKVRGVQILHSFGSKTVMQIEADLWDYALDKKGQIISGSKRLVRVLDHMVLEKTGKTGKSAWCVRDMQKQPIHEAG